MRTYGTVKYDAERREWVIECEAQVTLRLKRWFGKISERSFGQHRLSDTVDNARDLEVFLIRYPLRMAGPVEARVRSLADQHRERASVAQKLMHGRGKMKPVKLALPLREYQLTAVEMIRAMKGLLLTDELGLGKTAVAIGLLSHKDALPALVVTPTSLPPQWVSELGRFAPGLHVHTLKKGSPYDLEVGLRGAKVPKPDVIVSNYEKLAGWAETLAPYIRSVTFDEVQALRLPGSKKYAAALHLRENTAYRLGMSGTPIHNKGDEIHAVMEILRPGELGTRAEFLRERCGKVNMRGQASVTDPKALGEHMREEGMMLRRTRIEVGRQLPKLTRVPHVINADLAALEKVSSECRELALFILGRGKKPEHLLKPKEGEPPRSVNAQFLASEELSWRLRQATGLAKAPFVADFVRLLVEGGERVLLYGWHREVYRIWQERLKDLGQVLYTGSESVPQKVQAQKDFVEGRSKVLIMSLRAGVGLDGLQGICRTVVFGELDWSYGVHEQCEGRVHRDGQKEPVFAYYLNAEVGSDPAVLDALGIKRGQLEGIRDPNADLVQKLQIDPDHIKKLAEAYLQQRVA